MGSEQSKQEGKLVIVAKVRDLSPSGLFYLKDGQYISLTRDALNKCYVVEEEMTEMHRELLAKQNLIPAQLYEKAADGRMTPVAKKYYKSLGSVGLANYAMRIYWENIALAQVFGILAQLKVAQPTIDIDAIASQIIAKAARMAFEQFKAAVPREEMSKILAEFPMITDDVMKGRIIDVLIATFNEACTKIIQGGRRIRGSDGAEGSEGSEEEIPLMGAYGPMRMRGGASEGEEKLSIAKNLFLEKLAKNRQELVAQLLGIFDAMPYSGMKVSGTPEEKLRKIGEYIRTHPVQSGQSICREIAKAINKVFGTAVIDPALPSEICVTQMEELLNALSHGVSADFFLLGTDIMHNLRALVKLNETLKIWHKATKEKLKGSIDSVALTGTLDTIIGEFERYLNMTGAMLQQYYIPTLPGMLAAELEAKSTRRSGDKLNERILGVLQGLVTTTSQAMAVQVALEKIGLKPEEYRLMKNKRDFFKRFAELVPPEKLEASDEPMEYFKAAELAARGLGHAEELVAAIEEQKKVGRGVTGGATPAHLVVEKLTTKQGHLKIILNSYGQSLQAELHKIREAVDNFAGAIGVDIPIGSLLDNFLALLRQLVEVKLERPQVHLALLGYYRDAMSQEIHDTIIGTLRQVAKYAEAIAADASYAKAKHYFMAIHDSIEGLITAVDQATDSVKGIVGSEDERKEAEKVGGAPDSFEFMTRIRDLVLRDKLRLIDSVEKADYMIRVTQLKGNLKKMVEEFPNDTKAYDEKVLGPAVAARITDLQKAREYVLQRLNAETADVAQHAFVPSIKSTGDPGKSKHDFKDAKHQEYDFLSLFSYGRTDKDKDKIQPGVEGFVKDYYKSIIDFWEATQAIELYLKYFTNALINHPGEVQEIAMMIREVEIITQMYNDTSGNEIATIFEANFPANRDLSNELLSASDIKPAGVNKEANYYEWTNVGAFPFTQVLKGRLASMISDARKGLGKYVALKNLISFFVHFGSKIGGAELRKMSPRTPSEIYNGLLQFLAASSFAFGFNERAEDKAKFMRMQYVPNDGKFTVDEATGGTKADKGADSGDNARSPMGDDKSMYGCGSDAHMSDTVIMRPYQSKINDGASSSVVKNAYDDKTCLDLSVENEVFAAIIKSLGAKVLVLSGMHDLINRPHERHEARASVRVILGAAQEVPKVEESIAELYIRLPLLALYYKKYFMPEQGAPVLSGEYMNGTAKFILLPDIAGSVYSEFINLLFRKFPHTDMQFFTDNEMKLIIPEINKIYHKLVDKYPTDTIRGILNSFVEVMSRMVYLIGAKDESEYKEKLGTVIGEKDKLRADILEELPILGDEGDEDPIKRPLPSDMHVALKGGEKVESPEKFVVRGEHWNLVKKFRCMLDQHLTKQSSFSLRGSIVTAQMKLGQTSDDMERFRIVCGLVRGTGTKTPIENMRSMIFAEVLGTGLGTLSAIYSLVRNLQIVGYLTNPVEVAELIKTIDNATDNDTAIPLIARKLAEKLSILAGADETKDTEKIIQPILKIVMGYVDATHYHAMNGALTAHNDMKLVVNKGTDVALKSTSKITLTGDKTENATEAIAQYCLHYPSAMGLLLETVSTVISHTHEMLRVDVVDGQLHVDFATLQEYVRKFLTTLISFVDAMRPHIDPKVVEKYIAKENPGSLYWHREQFIEKLFEGRMTGAGQKYQTLESLTGVIRRGFEKLTSPINLDITLAAVGTTAGKDKIPSLASSFYVDYSNVLANIVAYNGERVVRPAGAPYLYVPTEPLSNAFDSLLIRNIAGEKTLDTRFLYPLAMTQEKYVYTDLNNSILFSFNKLLSMYLRQFYDASTGRIFLGLIDTFAQGTFNSAILSDRNVYPDCMPMYYVETESGSLVKTSIKHIISTKTYRVSTPDPGPLSPIKEGKFIGYAAYAKNRGKVQTRNPLELINYHRALYGMTADDPFIPRKDLFEDRWIPDGNHVLFASLGHIIGNILTVIDDRTQLRVHILESAADVPMYLREKYRAMLPFFRAAFDSLSLKCEFFKQIIENGQGKCFRGQTPQDAVAGLKERIAKLVTDIAKSKVMLTTAKGTIDATGATDAQAVTALDGAMGALDDAQTTTDEAEEIGRIVKMLNSALATSVTNAIKAIDAARKVIDAVNIEGADDKAKAKTAIDELVKQVTAFESQIKAIETEVNKLAAQPNSVGRGFNLAWTGYKVDANITSNLLGILKNISAGASALVQDSTRALTDIGDQPRYFEVAQDSIGLFRAQNGFDPIMPISPLLRVVAGDGKALDRAMLPMYSFGDANFKYQYAIRGLYHRFKVGKDIPNYLQTMAALESMFSLFNKYAQGSIKLGTDLAQDLARGLLIGFDFLHDVRRVRPFISIEDASVLERAAATSLNAFVNPLHMSIMREDTIVPSKMENRAIRLLKRSKEDKESQKIVPTPFGLIAPDMSSVVNIVENRSRESAVKLVLDATETELHADKDIIIENIIDANIIPFDLHVLARQMPLHFIWNYAYTFDAIVASMLHPGQTPNDVATKYLLDCVPDKDIAHAKEALFAMLVQPYKTLKPVEKQWVDRMLIGETGVPGFARPKFLSDQLAGKILLGDVLGLNVSEIGPTMVTQNYKVTSADIAQDNAERDEYIKFINYVLLKYRPKSLDEARKIIRGLILILTVVRPALQKSDVNDADYKDHLSRRLNMLYVNTDRDAADITGKPHDANAKAIIDTRTTDWGTNRAPAVAVALVFIAGQLLKGNNINNTSDKTQLFSMYGNDAEYISNIPALMSIIKESSITQVTVTLWKTGISKLAASFAYTMENAAPVPLVANAPRMLEVDEYGKEIKASTASVSDAAIVHDMRMDTLLVRNLIHISLVLSMVQMRLHGDVTYGGHRVAQAMSVLDPAHYKFYGYQVPPKAEEKHEITAKKYI